MTVRKALEGDAAAIASIYNYEIETGYAHFGTEPLAHDEVRDSISTSLLPWLVAVSDDEVIGFARAYTWKPRGAYRWTAEVGVYVSPEHQGKGVGRSLYEGLFESCRLAGLRTLVAGISLPNEVSIKLHEAMGMKHVGTLPKMGFKGGKWHDVGYWSLHFPDPKSVL